MLIFEWYQHFIKFQALVSLNLLLKWSTVFWMLCNLLLLGNVTGKAVVLSLTKQFKTIVSVTCFNHCCGTSSKLFYFGRAHFSFDHDKFAFLPSLLPSVSFYLLRYCLQPHLLQFHLKCFLQYPPRSHFLLLPLRFRFRLTHIWFATTSTIKWHCYMNNSLYFFFHKKS